MTPHPRGYVAARASVPPTIDGRLDDPAWGLAPWSAPFVDVSGAEVPTFETRMKMVWDEDALYIGAWLQEPNVWATLTEHDSIIFQDNDFEVFLDPDGDGHAYDELEINALNTTWDLRLVKPYLAGGQAQNEREIEGLRTAVWIDGTLNDPRDTDRGWSVEIALPWRAFGPRPALGDQWRINFSRVQWDVHPGTCDKVEGRPEHNWVWSEQGVIDMHRPERWGYVQFEPSATVPFRPDPDHAAKSALFTEWHRLREAGTPTAVSDGTWCVTPDYRLVRATD
jgi:hypothetical protein